MTSEPDATLLQQYVRTQDPVAFDQLAKRYRAMVFSIARRVTQSHHDAEDVAQSCFLELSRKAASIRSSIPAFLHATATRRSIDFLRHKKRRLKYETEAVIDRPELVVDESKERSWDEISPEVDEAIDRLPGDLKTFIILYFLRGLTVADIVVETGINRGIVERRLQLGVRRLRADLAKGNKVVSAGALAMGLRASSSHAVPATLTAATGRMALASVLRSPVPGPRSGFGGRIRADLLRNGWSALAMVGGVVAVSALALHLLSNRAGPVVPSDPYDRLSELYAGSMPQVDVGGFTRHTSAMRDDVSAFWRGSQPLFFQWCKTHCSDWVGDASSYTRCHASPNLEDAQRLSTLASTDNSAALPVQIELLQGLIITRLATDRNFDSQSGTTVGQVARILCRTYKSALLGEGLAPQVLRDPDNMLGSDKYLDSAGNFNSMILGDQGKLLAFLRPSPIDSGHIQQMIRSSLVSNPVLRAFCGTDPQVRDVRNCVLHSAVVNQGQLLLIVQLAGSGRLLELQQQIHAPAELAKLVPTDPRPPAQRAAEDAAVLSSNDASPVAWCQWQQMSFTVLPLDLHPQVYELRKDRWVDPVDAATCWAAASGGTHRRDPNRLALAAKITPELETQLIERSDDYLKSLQDDLVAFRSDPRVANDRTAVDQQSARWLVNPKPN